MQSEGGPAVTQKARWDRFGKGSGNNEIRGVEVDPLLELEVLDVGVFDHLDAQGTGLLGEGLLFVIGEGTRLAAGEDKTHIH